VSNTCLPRYVLHVCDVQSAYPLTYVLDSVLDNKVSCFAAPKHDDTIRRRILKDAQFPLVHSILPYCCVCAEKKASSSQPRHLRRPHLLIQLDYRGR
jgi:hypothetical protein